MTPAERTMREEKWMLTNELHDPMAEEPPEVIAFRVLQEEDWTHFVMNTEDNPALRFFNPEQRDFSHGEDWEDLCKIRGFPPFDHTWAIPEMHHDVDAFCREMRNTCRDRGSEGTGGCNAFHRPLDAENFAGGLGPRCALVVVHDGGCLAPYFNPSYEDVESYQLVDGLLKVRGLYREGINPAVTAIYWA